MRALWLRDRHGTFPGCTFPDGTFPATWADAHHLKHWARDRLTAQLTTTDTGIAVEWHRIPGSDDRTPTDHPPPDG